MPVGLSPGDVAEASPGPRVTICHFPPSDPAGVHLITVGAPIARAHVNNHNDAICPAGATDCCFDGHTPSACTNLQTDVNNCGICGHVCANTESCDRGVCTLSAAPLPFWLHYCADPNCGGLQPLVVHVCPEDNPPCTPSRQTTVVPRLDGHQIDQVLFPMQASDGGAGVIATLEAGAARS